MERDLILKRFSTIIDKNYFLRTALAMENDTSSATTREGIFINSLCYELISCFNPNLSWTTNAKNILEQADSLTGSRINFDHDISDTLIKLVEMMQEEHPDDFYL